jgi:hypothetical protein
MGKMIETVGKNDWPTVAAIGLLAMCMVTFDHEALGHGSMCLALHGHILALSSSVFRCDLHSDLIPVAGPTSNILCGLIALAVRLVVPLHLIKLRLFLLLVTAFSFFWEGGYLIQAMYQQDGDLYFFTYGWLGTVTVWQRWVGAALGLALYILSARLAVRALLGLWAEAKVARSVARTAWLSATIGAALAALAYTGVVPGDLRDAVLEIGAASFPLLYIPRHSLQSSSGHPVVAIARSYPVIIVALVVYTTFVATLGRGLT